MRYLLDTNVCVMYLNGRSTSARDRLLSVPFGYRMSKVTLSWRSWETWFLLSCPWLSYANAIQEVLGNNVRIICFTRPAFVSKQKLIQLCQV